MAEIVACVPLLVGRGPLDYATPFAPGWPVGLPTRPEFATSAAPR